MKPVERSKTILIPLPSPIGALDEENIASSHSQISSEAWLSEMFTEKTSPILQFL